MPVSITKRLDKGAPLTPAEEDANIQNLKDAIDALTAAQGVALNNDGTLKVGAVNDITKIASSVLALIGPPVGSVLATTHATLGTNAGADGWIYADGSSQVRTGNFAALFALIGTTYGPGSAPGSTFAMPDYRGRVMLGVSPGSLSMGRDTAYTLATEVATQIGEEKHVLIPTEGPIHDHTIDSRNYLAAGVQSELHIISETVKWVGGLNHTSTDNAGGDGLAAAAHENRMPSAVIRFCIKL